MKKLLSILSLMVVSFSYHSQNIVNSMEEVVNFYPIRYTDGMDIFSNLSHDFEFALQLKYKVKGTNNFKYANFSNGKVLLSGFKLDDEVEIYVTTSNSIWNADEPIFVSSAFDDVIEVSPIMSKRIGSYTSKEGQDKPIDVFFKELIEQNNIDVHEAISYAQQFYFEENNTIHRGKGALDEIFENAKRDRDDEVVNRYRCKCRYTLNRTGSAAPVGNPTNVDETTGIYQPILDTYMDNSSGNIFRMSLEKGPAHLHRLLMSGSHGSSNYQHSTLGVSGNVNTQGAPNYARVAYNFTCLEEFRPRECGCVKKVLFKYRYDVSHYLRGAKPSFFWSNGQEVGVEDFALIMARHGNNQFEMIEGNRMRNHTTCTATWNLQFFMNLVDAAASALAIMADVMAPVGDDEEEQSFWEILGNNLSSLTNQAQNMISTPIINNSGGCQIIQQNGTLLNGMREYELYPNKPVEFVMTTFTYIGGRGFGKWDLEARSLSNFAMSAIILPYAQSTWSTATDPFWCCSDKVGQYVLGSLGGPLNEPNLRAFVGAHITTWSPWTNLSYNSATGLPMLTQQNVGRVIWLNPNEDCAETIPQNVINEEEEPIYEDGEMDTKSTIVMQGNNQQVLMYPNPANDRVHFQFDGFSDELINIEVVDMMGRIVDSKNSIRLSDMSNIYSMGIKPGTNSGAYLVRVYANNSLVLLQRLIIK